MSPKVTLARWTARREALQRASASRLGVVEFHGTRGLQSAAWGRMMERMRDLGYVKPYVHGGYEITDAGRAWLAEGSMR